MVIENQQIVAFTEAAATKLSEVLKEQDAEGSYLRIAVTQSPAGAWSTCSGSKKRLAKMIGPLRLAEFGR